MRPMKCALLGNLLPLLHQSCSSTSAWHRLALRAALGRALLVQALGKFCRRIRIPAPHVSCPLEQDLNKLALVANTLLHCSVTAGQK